MLTDQGGFGGFWPAGYLVELRDADTGEWIELGDLAESNRFEIADADAAVSETGRIEVRVTADGDNAQLGQTSVFVSAEIAGVLDE